MDNLSEDYENLSELEDEWDNGAGEFDEPMFTDEERESVRKEIAALEKFAGLAESISHDAKGNVLLKALGTGFQKANELGARRKALIFT
jgi:adenine-specific DNA-methyltransferase